MTAPRTLLTGATGLLGSRLLPRLAALGPCTGLGRRAGPPGGLAFDLTDRVATLALLEELQPTLIVHAAAMTDVDRCQREPAAAYRLNVVASQTFAEWQASAARPCRLVQISTDHVYDAPGPSPEDRVQPVNVYALTKLWAEDHARRAADSLILRVNFFGLGGASRRGFADWVVESCAARLSITLFRDVFFNPLHADTLADLVVELIERGETGTYNLGASGEGLSKGAFILALARRLGLSTEACREGSRHDVALAAPRPSDTRMATARIEALLGRGLPTLEQGIEHLAGEWDERALAAAPAESLS